MMDRAGLKAPPLTLGEWETAFAAVSQGKGQRETRELLSGRNRVTVYRAYNVASQFHLRRPTKCDDHDAAQIAEAAGYSATPSYVQKAFVHWMSWQTHQGGSLRPGLETKLGPRKAGHRLLKWAHGVIVDVRESSESSAAPGRSM